MALNEDALESLIQGGDRRHGKQVKVAERTDEFEVYERATPRDIMTDTLQQEAAQVEEPPQEPATQAVPVPADAVPQAQEPPTPQPTAPATHEPTPEAAPAPVAQEPAPAAPQETAPVPQEPAPHEATRPAAPMLRFPGTTGKPPNLGIASTPDTPPGPADAPEATTDPWSPATPEATDPWSQATGPDSTPGGDVQVALVQADFNPQVTDEMARLATERARALGATVVQHVHVAGAFDLPLTVQALARRDGIEAVVALGCVIQGETGHDLTITDAAAAQLARIACETETPIGFGVIGPRMTKEQAEARVQVGANAMESAIRQVRTLRQIADPAQVDGAQYASLGH